MLAYPSLVMNRLRLQRGILCAVSEERGKRRLAVTSDCSLLGSYSFTPVCLPGITSGSSNRQSWQGLAAIHWEYKKGRGREEGEHGEGKQHRQARSDWIILICLETLHVRGALGCSSLAKATLLNQEPKQRWLPTQHTVIFCRKPRNNED